MWITYVFRFGFNPYIYLKVMMVVGAVISLLICLLIRWTRKKHPIIFRLSMILHVFLLIYTIYSFSRLDEPVRLPNYNVPPVIK